MDQPRAIPPGALRRRLLRHYLPLALVSVAAIVVLANVAYFDVNRYPPPADIFTEGAKGALPSGEYPPPVTPSGGSTGHQAPASGRHGGPATQERTADDAGAEDGDDDDSVLRWRRFATMTGYVAVGFVAATLLIGPLGLLRRRRLPLSSYLRRDVGLWAAVISAVHVVFGVLVEHGDGELLGYFFEPGDRTRPLTNSFGLANWTGLGALVIAAVLAAISSDVALRRLKARRWKRLQRWNYALAALTVAHAVFYGALWRLTSPYTVLLVAATTIVVAAQIVGIRLWRQRRRQPAAP